VPRRGTAAAAVMESLERVRIAARRLQPPSSMDDFVRKALIALGLAALAFVLWRASYALLLGFGGVVFAVFLRGTAHQVGRWTGVGMRPAVGVVCLALIAIVAGCAALIGPAIASQFDQLGITLTKGLEQAREYLESTSWGQPVLEALSSMGQGGNLVGVAASAVISAIDGLLGVVLIVVAGAYLALAPRDYMEGAVHLLPNRRHARAREVLRVTGNALWLWLLGQLVIMLVVGVLTAVGLWLVGVPLAAALGLIAGLAEFVPFLGPILASVPILVVALTEGPQVLLYALAVLLVIQQTESNLLAPLVERRAVSLPPVLILIGTIALSLLFGVLGLIFAAPLLVVLMVWTKMLYMQDALDENVRVPGER
jgi:predicted PurR-regulated permease PerM